MIHQFITILSLMSQPQRCGIDACKIDLIPLRWSCTVLFDPTQFCMWPAPSSLLRMSEQVEGRTRHAWTCPCCMCLWSWRQMIWLSSSLAVWNWWCGWRWMIWRWLLVAKTGIIVLLLLPLLLAFSCSKNN